MTDTNEIQRTIVYVLMIYVPLNQKSEGRGRFSSRRTKIKPRRDK